VRDKRLMHPMNVAVRDITPQQVAAFWASFDNQFRYFFGIFDAENNPVGFWQIECEDVHAVATGQLAVDPAYRGASVVLDTGVAICDWLFGARKMEKLVIVTLPTNRHVLSLLKRFGFQQEGYLRQEVRSLAGPGRLDQIRFGMLPQDWQSARTPLLAFTKKKRQGP
jgi:RimJ/RimL family protein N-acetyltransferase